MKLRLKTVSPLRRGDAEKNKEVQLNPKVAVAHTTFKCVLKTLRLSVSAVNSIFLKTPLLLVSALKFLASISQNYHSMNVTLLISRNVVVPCRSFSTADSRRNVIPSSRAARLISDVGRLFKINSRRRSDKSSSS